MLGIRVATVAFAAITLAALGCGSSKPAKSAAGKEQTGTTSPPMTQTQAASSPASTSKQTPPLTRQQLIARADSLCAKLNERLSATRVSGFRDYANKLPPLGTYEQATAAQLAQLTPPASLKHDWDRIVSSMRTLGTDLLQLAKYADARNTARLHSLIAQASAIRNHMTSTASRNGFKDCAH